MASVHLLALVEKRRWREDESARREKNKKIHVIVHMTCHVGKTTVERGFEPG